MVLLGHRLTLHRAGDEPGYGLRQRNVARSHVIGVSDTNVWACSSKTTCGNLNQGIQDRNDPERSSTAENAADTNTIPHAHPCENIRDPSEKCSARHPVSGVHTSK